MATRKINIFFNGTTSNNLTATSFNFQKSPSRFETPLKSVKQLYLKQITISGVTITGTVPDNIPSGGTHFHVRIKNIGTDSDLVGPTKEQSNTPLGYPVSFSNTKYFSTLFENPIPLYHPDKSPEQVTGINIALTNDSGTPLTVGTEITTGATFGVWLIAETF